MTLILVSQAPTTHSRLGNSLVWMSKLSYLLDKIEINAYFPWAYETFQSYLPDDSRWIEHFKLSRDLFLSIFGAELTATHLCNQARLIQVEYEQEHSLAPFQWNSLVHSTLNGDVLFMSGGVDITSSEIVSQMYAHELVVIHEPFLLEYKSNLDLVGENYAAIAPRNDLLSRESRVIESQCFGRKTEALHIRRGDYSKWQGGAYFYPDDFWNQEAFRVVQDGCVPWIFSNDLTDDLSNSLIQKGAVVSRGSFEVDFVRLMLMDRISGPPSTFTGMAAKIAHTVLGRYPKLTYYKNRNDI